ncbi:MAG TPA: 3,4-dehydroadipyl-CoA semialdehyde dehydrogenase [Microvirga sp.]|jgi:3,4-dehydroadipyl-CoA semialdehyde dehydrogenase|nr:3,4-dehydroadipyl-CoA semialdehyde dehydrogenase [Microvirga sp.]
MIRLESYVNGAWRAGSAEGRPLVNPTTGEVIGSVDATGVDVASAFQHARRVGGPTLRGMTFAERGELLGAIANALAANRDAYAEIARVNSGNTASDAAIDVDGGIGTLKYYARLAKGLGAHRALIEAGDEQLSRAETFRARHVWTSRMGVALHINAYNFPSWGLWEKAAVALLGGVPVIAKPASATAWLSERMVRDVVAAGVLPPGVLQLVCGAGEDLLDELQPMDSLAFTGSAKTGDQLRGHARVLEAAPRVSIEADSINAAVLMPGTGSGSPVFDVFLKEVVRAVSVKAGQMCTNIRRVFVPADQAAEVSEAIRAAVGKITVGDPGVAEVKLGPVVHEGQRQSALEGIRHLQKETRVIAGGDTPENALNADPKRGAFVAPTVLAAESAADLGLVHELEVFGPVLTILPYRTQEDAAELCRRGGGSLTASLYGEDPATLAATALDIGSHHGRVLVVDPVVGAGHTGHSIVMPQCVHGGPGRAGGGEELGGLRGLRFYMQRTALQGSPDMLKAVEASAAPAAL